MFVEKKINKKCKLKIRRFYVFILPLRQPLLWRLYLCAFTYTNKCILKSIQVCMYVYRCVCKRLPCWRSADGPKVHFAVIKFC